MFNKNDYKAAFSKVTASGETYRRVMNMTNERKPRKGRRTVTKILVLAAIVSLLAVTASATEYIQSWFTVHFSGNNEKALSSEQISYIEENEQVFNETQTQDDWTVELRSAMSDGNTAYIIIGVTAPEGVSLEQEKEDLGYMVITTDRFELRAEDERDFGIISCSEKLFSPDDNYYVSGTTTWEEDGDGLNNTKNVVMQLTVEELGRDTETKIPDLFGSNTEWYIHVDSIIHEYENKEYKQELLNGKYKGQTDIMFTSEETQMLQIEEVLAEGPWNFSFSFAGNEMGVEVLTEPVSTTARIWRKYGDSIEEYDHFMEEVTITSFILRPLSATIRYDDCNGAPSFDYEDVYAVMKDGGQIVLHYGSSGGGSALLEAESPIVLENVDHILLADGTILPMPDLSAE